MSFRINPGLPACRIGCSIKGIASLLILALVPIAHALPVNGTWNDQNKSSAFAPNNRHGHNPVYGTIPKRARGHRFDRIEKAEAAGSSNYVLSVPILSLPGRGLDLNLALTYNSQIWHDDGSGIEFDPDVGWPAPGWSLGFGKIVRFVTNTGICMIVDADGTRHTFSGTTQFSTGNAKFTGHTTDGTLIDYVVNMPLGPAGVTNAQARYPDGTIVTYDAPGDLGNGAIFPTRITDAQGNYVSISYRNGHGPMIDTITDTLGRTVTFHYDSTNRLISIVRPGLNGTPQAAARLHYANLGLTTLDAIFYPADSSGYWFGESDSYSQDRILKTIRQQRAMTVTTTSLDNEGSVTSTGTNNFTRTYNYPGIASGTRFNIPASIPTYSTMTERWSDMDTAAAVTNYSVTPGTAGAQITITDPDGTKTAVTEDGSGLVSKKEVMRADGKVLSSSSFTWETGDYGSPRLKRIESTDEIGQTTAQEYSYGTNNQVTEQREYDYGGTKLLRRERTDFLVNQAYAQRHILNLPTVQEVYDGANLVPVARTEYQYDTESLEDTPGVLQHDPTYDPFTPPIVMPGSCTEQCTQPNLNKPPKCKEVCTPDRTVNVFNPATLSRGNLTRITQYAVAATRSGATTEVRRYDITGNVRQVTGSACCEQLSTTYGAATQYAYPTAVTAGASSPGSTAHRTVLISYDPSTGLPLSVTEPNGRWQEFQYSPTSLRIEHVLQKTHGAATPDYQVDTTYDDANLAITETTVDPGRHIARKVTEQRNGLGLVRKVQTFPDTGIIDVRETKFDAKKRVWQQSRPYRSGFIPQWTLFSYDGLDRIYKRVEPDGSTTTYAFNDPQRPGDASQGAGRTTYQVDPWGRGRWSRFDALGRLVEVLEPNPSGAGSVFTPGAIDTHYTYDALNDLVGIDRGKQHAVLVYDSRGRLIGQRLPEKDRTLTPDGQFSRAYGIFSDVYTYDARGNIESHTDARGIKTIFDKGNDPLNRLTHIHFDMSGYGDTANVVANTDDVTFTYLSIGDVGRLESASTASATESLAYNDRSLLDSTMTVLSALPDYPIGIAYQYDAFDRLGDAIYPAEYGFSVSPNLTGKKIYHHKSVHLDYDAASRPKHLTVDGDDYASSIQYDAQSQVISLNTGSGSSLLDETYDLDALTGLVNAQQVGSPAGPLLSLSFGYTRDGVSGRTGQVTKVIDQLDKRKSRMYDYDALGRLSRVTLGLVPSLPPSYWTQTYGYDLYGNRIQSKAFGSPPISHCTPGGRCVPPPPPELGPDRRDGLDGVTYDEETNRISTPGYAYDAAGNLVRAQAMDGTWQRFQYDAAGRLVLISDDNEKQIEKETFGASSMRLARTAGAGNVATGNTTVYGWSGDQVIAEYHLKPAALADKLTWSKDYIYLGGRLVATHVPSQPPGAHPGFTSQVVNYYHPDRLGTRLVTDGAHNVVTTRDLYSFGVEPAGTAANDDTRKFTSYDRSNQTGLDYAANRFYSPALGRFTQVDPLNLGSVSLAKPQSMNLYTYVENDPLNATDDYGLAETSAPEIDCFGISNGDGSIQTVCVDPGVIVTPPPTSPLSPPPAYGYDSSNTPSSSARGGGAGGSGKGSGNQKDQDKWDHHKIAQCMAIQAQRNQRFNSQVASYNQMRAPLVSGLSVLGGISSGLGIAWPIVKDSVVESEALAGVVTDVSAATSLVGGVASGYALHAALVNDPQTMVALSNIDENLKQIDADMRGGLNCPDFGF